MAYRKYLVAYKKDGNWYRFANITSLSQVQVAIDRIVKLGGEIENIQIKKIEG